MALDFASPALRDNFHVVQSAVMQNGLALQFASDGPNGMRSRQEIVLSTLLRETHIAI